MNSSFNHLPRSTILQRPLQNGLYGISARFLKVTFLRHVGQTSSAIRHLPALVPEDHARAFAFLHMHKWYVRSPDQSIGNRANYLPEPFEPAEPLVPLVPLEPPALPLGAPLVPVEALFEPDEVEDEDDGLSALAASA